MRAIASISNSIPPMLALLFEGLRMQTRPKSASRWWLTTVASNLPR